MRPRRRSTSSSPRTCSTSLAADRSGSADLARLCKLVAAGRLDGQIECEGSWRDPRPAFGALLERRIGGKAVLHVD
jgi:hypothetical protein